MTIKFFDCDRHVAEPMAMWSDYLDPKYNDYLPYLVEDTLEDCAGRTIKYGADKNFLLFPEVHVKGMPLYNNWSEPARIDVYLHSQKHKSPFKATTGEKQIESMDAGNAEIAYIFPSAALCLVNSEQLPADVKSAYANAYNRWLLDYCKYDVARLRAIGVVNRYSPDAMLSELDIIINNGWTSVTLRPEVLGGRDLGHADYEEFWKRCESNNIAVAFHGSTHLYGNTAGTERYNTRFALHACSHPMEAQMAFLSLLESGVLDRYPSLKFAFFEAGASWLPAWLWRLDELCYDTMPTELSHHIKMKPSDYFKRQCWIGFEFGEPCLREVANCVGIEKMLFGSDFPHPDHSQFDIEALQEESDFSIEELELILQNNPGAFFEKQAI